jgi:hypothetical protein
MDNIEIMDIFLLFPLSSPIPGLAAATMIAGDP